METFAHASEKVTKESNCLTVVHTFMLAVTSQFKKRIIHSEETSVQCEKLFNDLLWVHPRIRYGKIICHYNKQFLFFKK